MIDTYKINHKNKSSLASSVITMNIRGSQGPSLGGSVVKNPPANVGDAGLIPSSGRSPGNGNGNLLQYSCLGNLRDRGAWQATVHGVAKESDRT